MNLKVESNAYVKLENMEKVSNVDVLIGEYTFNDYILKGEIVLKGNYYTSNIFLDENNESVSFENTIPFEVVFTKEEPILKDIQITNFEYYEIVGRGIETNFIINIEYDKKDELREEIASKIDEILEEKIGNVEDNFFETQKESITEKERNNNKIKSESFSKMKIIYYNDSENIKDLCQKYNLSYTEVLEENQKYDFNNSRRIIISEKNGNPRKY